MPESAPAEVFNNDLMSSIVDDKQRTSGQPKANPETASASPDEKTEDTPENDPSKSPSEDEDKEDEDEKKKSAKSSKKKEPEDQTVKIGNREFASVDDAIKEANRVIGHNANLAGQVTTLQGENETLRTGLKELREANQEWAAWAASIKAGKDIDPKMLIKATLDEYKNSQSQAEGEKQMHAELNELKQLSNFTELVPHMYKIADRVNPLTGEFFTPREAYRFVCQYFGLENQLDKKPASPQVPKKPAPKAPVAPPVPARPTGANQTKTPPKKNAPDDADIELGRYLS